MAPITLTNGWNRPKAATTEAKSPVFDVTLTQTATGYVVDITVDTTDPDFVTKTIVMKHVHTLSIVGGVLVDTAINYQYDGNDAYTNSTSPATSAASATGSSIEVGRSSDLDSFWTTGGFAKT